MIQFQNKYNEIKKLRRCVNESWTFCRYRVRRKLVQPKLTVREETEGTTAWPLPVLCARPGHEQPIQLHFCHGTFERLVSLLVARQTEEQLRYSDKVYLWCCMCGKQVSLAIYACNLLLILNKTFWGWD